MTASACPACPLPDLAQRAMGAGPVRVALPGPRFRDVGQGPASPGPVVEAMPR